MKFTSTITALALVASTALAHPLDTHEIRAAFESLEERQNIVVTTGAGGSTIYPRLEVRQMLADFPDQYTLFLLALQQWKTGSESDPTSFAGVSTVHGVPRQNYNNVGQCSTCSTAVGYCTHNIAHFPAWHRTYLALFEQEFLQVVDSIANAWPAATRANYQAAASVMRFPYWDWAALPPNGLPPFPNIFTEATQTINAQNGQTTINNPLLKYTFANPSNLYYEYFTQWDHTVRWPSSDSPGAYSVEGNVVNAFKNNRKSLQQQVYSLMTQCSDYLHFSNAAQNPGATDCTNSLEGIHNTIHTLTGGVPNNTYTAGHMTYLPLASYDPVFWLHHMNVDRYFAFWQTLHPNAYSYNQVVNTNTWTIPNQSTVTPNSPLTPFYKNTAGAFWTTNEVRQWGATFKYTYPEYTSSDGSSSSILNYVNKLYGPGATATAGSTPVNYNSLGTAQAENASPISQLDTNTAGSSSSSSPDQTSPKTPSILKSVNKLVGDVTQESSAINTNPLAALDGSSSQYFANVQYPVFTLGNSYSIHVFNGEPQSEDPFSWTFDPNQIGMIGVPTMPGMTDNKLKGTGSVPLTQTLTDIVGSGLLSSLAQEIVVPFLTSKLQWRIAGPQGQSIDPMGVEGFVVSVVTNTVKPASDPGVLPTFSELVTLPEITKNKAGGLNATASTAPEATSQGSSGGLCHVKRVMIEY